jgi:YVTN family beta-propeller protein
MDPLARADYEDLHWGALVANAVRVLDARQLNGRNTETVTEGWLDYFGGIGSATGDPGTVVTGPSGLVAVALSGIGEIAIRRGGYATRLPVGRGPEAMAVSGDRLFVANRFSDSVSVIDLPLGKTVQTIPLGPTPELSAVDRGELLFFDARLSHDGWMSCHSCHTDGHSSGLLVDTLGDGDYGAPKRIPSLLGTRNTGPWAWNGSVPTLAEQVRKSVTTTMHGDAINEEQTADLVAYLESLPPPPAAHPLNESLTASGQAAFKSLGCVQCHTGPNYTSAGTFDVGLSDEENRRRFNPPSLRGVGQRDRLFHDGRALGLEDAIGRVRHRLDKPLSVEESTALLAYLRSL